MGREIERKFLVRDDSWRGLGPAEFFQQGYLSSTPERTVRVRLAGDRGWLTIKGLTHQASRAEYEYPIPAEDAREMLSSLCEQPVLEKRRSRIRHAGMDWEVDEFLGENAGLVVAEVELPSADHPVELPAWIGQEVTDDPRYYNTNLLAHPYSRWSTPA